MNMTLTAWGLILDIVGVLMVALGTMETRKGKDDFLRFVRGAPDWVSTLGWTVVAVGFGLQLLAEIWR